MTSKRSVPAYMVRDERPDKDSEKPQRAAIERFAKAAGVRARKLDNADKGAVSLGQSSGRPDGGLAVRCMNSRPQSRKVYCEAFKIGKRAVSESAFVRGTQDHTRRVACLECFLPSRGTEAPTVTRVQAWKAECGNWCRKIVAARFGEFEKRRSHNGTDRVTANVLSPGVAAAIPIKSRHGFDRTDIKRLAEHISWATPPTASVTPIVPQHCRLPPSPNSQQASD